MEQLLSEFGHSTHTPFAVVAARLLLATLFGAAIGFEREWRNRPAGLRTHILVCVASATFAILTIEIVHAPTFSSTTLGDAVKVDPIRVVEAVTAGVAFLAAGVVAYAFAMLWLTQYVHAAPFSPTRPPTQATDKTGGST